MKKMKNQKLPKKSHPIYKKFKSKMKLFNQDKKNAPPALMPSLTINKNLKIIISLTGISLMLKEKLIKRLYLTLNNIKS